MNKAFLREPERSAEYCPRCGSEGETVSGDTLSHHVPAARRGALSVPANFCPSPTCEVAYFDAFEQIVLASELHQPVYPKDPAAPICACFGLTRDQIEQDVHEGVVTRTRAALEQAKSPAARCQQLAANGRSCVAYVQKCFLHCRASNGRA